MPIPKRRGNENENDFMQRCMSDEKMKSEYDQEQRISICKTAFTELANEKISFDYDLTLSTKKGFEKAQQLIKQGNSIYVISARDEKQGMLKRTRSLGIDDSKVYAVGSNEKKIEKIKELGIDIHYDDNRSVVKALNGIGKLIV
jgi:soluble P-type ATPase